MASNSVNTSECFPSGPSCNPDHYGVALVQADNVYGLERGSDQGDPGDLFFPPCFNALTGSTSPSSDLYNGSSTNVSITNINRPGPVLSAKVSDANASADPVVQNVQDGCFEGGTPNADWNEASTNFGTPLCTELDCLTGGGTGPHSGEWWAWFGGITGISETGSVDQSLTIPNASCSILNFYLEIPAFADTGFMNVKMDTDTLFTVTEANASSYPNYTMVTLDLSAYGDNSAHNLKFESTTDGIGLGSLNFFIDDVGLYAQFSDIGAGFWAENYITSLSCSNVVGGFPDGTYKPTQQVNRAQMSAFIVRAVDGTEPADCVSDPFPDVSTGFWACKYIKRAVDLGIVSGFPDGTYRPTQIVNRGQMAAFIIKGMIADGQLPGEPADCVSDPFPDVPSGHTFCKYIQELVNQGIASGFGDGTYKPTQQVNRAQMSVFVGRGFLP
jgi:hypothetical protein